MAQEDVQHGAIFLIFQPDTS